MATKKSVAKKPAAEPVKRKEDHSATNAGLHRLYTDVAVCHLTHIDRFLDKLSSFSNLNMMDMQEAVRQQRAKLVEENQAYTDADMFMQTMRTGKDNTWREGRKRDEERLARSINELPTKD